MMKSGGEREGSKNSGWLEEEEEGGMERVRTQGQQREERKESCVS